MDRIPTATTWERTMPAVTNARSTAVVVGGGPAGLAAAAELRLAGVPALVLEQGAAIAHAWRGRYDRLRLNSSRITSRLNGFRYTPGASLFPSRDEFVAYLERFAAHHRVAVRTGVRVERIERRDGGWVLATPAGELVAQQVIVATGYARVPSIPRWPGRDEFEPVLLHSAQYRNVLPFRGRDVLVAGAGSSGMEIAYDLVAGGARRVRLAVRTPPNILLRSARGVPGDLPAVASLKLPTRLADAQTRALARLMIGDLREFGLPSPGEGPFARLRRLGVAPTIVDRDVIAAIKSRRIEVVPGVESLDASGVRLAGGERVEPDAVIAATGYRCGLEAMVGQLGVLGRRGVPRVAGGLEAAPGLRFIGFTPLPGQIRLFGVEARGAAAAVAHQLGSCPP
jgi:cation diffusion facilitator CzcD-associated flavoprotein CzcO